jgi:hypothetical protein
MASPSRRFGISLGTARLWSRNGTISRCLRVSRVQLASWMMWSTFQESFKIGRSTRYGSADLPPPFPVTHPPMLTLRRCVVGVVAVLVVVTVAGCGGNGVFFPDNPFSPTPVSAPTPTPPPTPTPEATRIIGLSGNLAFGDVQVGTSVSTTVTISNTGNSTLTITNRQVASGHTTGQSCCTTSASSASIPAGDSVVRTLTFTSTRVDVYDGNLGLFSDKTSGDSNILMTGSGQ